MLSTKEVKEILVQKFKDENCYFKKSDISVRTVKDGYNITVKDYEFITFKVRFEKDDYFGYCVYVLEKQKGRQTVHEVAFESSKCEYKEYETLLQLGYRIANTF